MEMSALRLPHKEVHGCAGTPLFLPPEMFMRHWGPEADLWSIGMVAYQLLSGKAPPPQPSVQVVLLCTQAYVSLHR